MARLKMFHRACPVDRKIELVDAPLSLTADPEN